MLIGRRTTTLLFSGDVKEGIVGLSQSPTVVPSLANAVAVRDLFDCCPSKNGKIVKVRRHKTGISSGKGKKHYQN